MSVLSPIFNFILNDSPHFWNSLKFNFHYFDFATAVKFPVWVSRNVDLQKLKGKVILPDTIKSKMIKIGFGHVPIFDKKYDRSVWSMEGEISFKGEVELGHSSRIHVSAGAYLEFGHNTCITAACSIICEKKISIGNSCLISWETLIMDTDYHNVYNDKGELINSNTAIVIADKTWIGTRCTILKGTVTAPHTIIGANSLTNKPFTQSHVLIAGSPAKVVKENVSW